MQLTDLDSAKTSLPVTIIMQRFSPEMVLRVAAAIKPQYHKTPQKVIFFCVFDILILIFVI